MEQKTKRSKIIFYVLTGLFWFSLYTYVPVFPAYVETRTQSYSFLGIILGSYGLTQLIFRIPVGILSDLLGKRRIFILSGAVFTVISGICLFLFDSPAMILAGRVFAGLAASMWVVFAVVFSGYFSVEDAPRAMGYLIAATTAGQVAAMSAGGFIAEYHGIKYTFLAAALTGVLAMSASFLVKDSSTKAKDPVRFSSLPPVMLHKPLLYASFLGIISQFMTFATTFGFTPIYAERLGASPYELGLLITLSSLPGILSGALSGSYFADKIGVKYTLLIGLIFTSASILAIPFSGSFTVLLVTQIIGGFAKGMVFPLLMGIGIRDIGQDKRATALGFYQAVYGLGMFLGPVVTGIVTDNFSLETGFFVVGIIGLSVSILVSIIKIKKQTV